VAITFEHDTAAHQYRLLRDGELLSLADYRVVDGATVDFDHTLTPPAHRGNGYAADLVGRALDDVRSSGHTIVASCWFVAEFLQLHPEYQDLRA
jgi:predicted GNAT family acetyltransferase